MPIAILFFLFGISAGHSQLATSVAAEPTVEVKKEDSLPKSDLSKGLSVAIGGRFSFVQEPKVAGRLYYDISGFFPNLFCKSKRGDNRIVGFDFGLFETGPEQKETNANEDSGDIHSPTIVFNEIGFNSQPTPDSVSAVYRTYARSYVSRKSTGIGIYLSPTFQISSQFYLLAHFEHRRSESTSTIEDQILNTDTATISLEAYRDETNYEIRPWSSFATSHQLHDTYSETLLGIGALFFVPLSEGVTLRLKPVINYRRWEDFIVGNSGSYSFQGNNYLNFLLDFRIIDSRHIGLKLGGELQGAWYPDGLSVFGPSIYLSKVIGFNKLEEFLKP